MFSIAFAVFALGAVASPLLPRQSGCQPNFEGVGVTVINNQLEWSAPPAAGQGSDLVSAAADPTMPFFHFEFSGQPTNTYLIRSLQVPQFPELVVSAAPDGSLQLDQQILSITSPDQAWTIQCGTCNTGASSGFSGLYASTCTITSLSTSQCAQIDTTLGDQLVLAPCDGLDHQNFDFYV